MPSHPSPMLESNSGRHLSALECTPIFLITNTYLLPECGKALSAQ